MLFQGLVGLLGPGASLSTRIFSSGNLEQGIAESLSVWKRLWEGRDIKCGAGVGAVGEPSWPRNEKQRKSVCKEKEKKQMCRKKPRQGRQREKTLIAFGFFVPVPSVSPCSNPSFKLHE